MLNNKVFARVLGVILIGFSISFFIRSLNSRLNRDSGSVLYKKRLSMRITADIAEGELYLWGVENGMVLKSSRPIDYLFKDEFYVISIKSVEQPYTLEVFDKGTKVAKFRYLASESYPIYADQALIP